MKIEAFLDQSPLFAVSWAARKFEAYQMQLFRDENLNFLEALILVSILLEEPAKVSPSRLSETFATTRGNISHALSSLEAKGMILRRIDAEDARSFHLALKPLGRRTAMQVVRTLDALQKSFEKSIGMAEIKSALVTIRKLESYFARVTGQ